MVAEHESLVRNESVGHQGKNGTFNKLLASFHLGLAS